MVTFSNWFFVLTITAGFGAFGIKVFDGFLNVKPVSEKTEYSNDTLVKKQTKKHVSNSKKHTNRETDIGRSYDDHRVHPTYAKSRGASRDTHTKANYSADAYSKSNSYATYRKYHKVSR